MTGIGGGSRPSRFAARNLDRGVCADAGDLSMTILGRTYRRKLLSFLEGSFGF